MKRFYYNLECTILEPNPHQSICASQKTPHKMMGTGMGGWFDLKMAASLKACLFLKVKQIQHNH